MTNAEQFLAGERLPVVEREFRHMPATVTIQTVGKQVQWSLVVHDPDRGDHEVELRHNTGRGPRGRSRGDWMDYVKRLAIAGAVWNEARWVPALQPGEDAWAPVDGLVVQVPVRVKVGLSHLERLEAETKRQQAVIEDQREVVGLLLRDVKAPRDHGCPECVPEGGDLVDPDFRCARHRAVRMVDGPPRSQIRLLQDPE